MSAPEKVVIGNAELWFGDCMDVLPLLPQVSAVVTDPPYGLSFMGKRWDYDVPATDLWELVLERLLPGGHLLAFAGTRTQHRMAVRIEDAGFEIRDMLAWVYGSGFPKSLDVSKAIDKAAGAAREQVKPRSVIGHQRNIGNHRPWMDDPDHKTDSDIPVTDAAHQWQGWGTALKPALEPITMARKPLTGTVAKNVMEHGTGALNIDGCRVQLNGDYKCKANGRPSLTGLGDNYDPLCANQLDTVGRWPANLIHDGSDEVVALFPQSKGQQGAVSGNEPSSNTSSTFGEYAERTPAKPRGDIGSAARFFYCAKTSKSDRGEGNDHPTVKPTALMRYLCRLITPPDGIILDPFMGSGSTGKAAMLEGFRFIGIERDEKYFQIACERIARAQAQGQLIPHEVAQPVQESMLD